MVPWLLKYNCESYALHIVAWRRLFVTKYILISLIIENVQIYSAFILLLTFKHDIDLQYAIIKESCDTLCSVLHYLKINLTLAKLQPGQGTLSSFLYLSPLRVTLTFKVKTWKLCTALCPLNENHCAKLLQIVCLYAHPNQSHIIEIVFKRALLQPSRSLTPQSHRG